MNRCPNAIMRTHRPAPFVDTVAHHLLLSPRHLSQRIEHPIKPLYPFRHRPLDLLGYSHSHPCGDGNTGALWEEPSLACSCTFGASCVFPSDW